MSEKFIELTHKDEGHERENLWLQHCQKTGIPFVVIRQHGKVADIHWDYISFPSSVDHGLFALELGLHEAVSHIFNEYGTKHSRVSFSPTVVTFQKFTASSAPQVANRLYDAVHQVTKPLLSSGGVNA